jgi:hypothetical protein
MVTKGKRRKQDTGNYGQPFEHCEAGESDGTGKLQSEFLFQMAKQKLSQFFLRRMSSPLFSPENLYGTSIFNCVSGPGLP